MQSERLILQAMWSLAREQLPAVIRDMTAAAEVTRNSYLFSHGIDLTDGQLYLTGGLLGLYGKRSLWTEAFYESIRRIEQVWGARGIRQILMGEDLFERNHLAEACPHFLQGMNEAMFHHCNGGVTAAALGISRVRRAAGDPEGARQIIDEARLWLSRHEIHHQDPPLDAWEALLDQENGQLDAASQWIRHSHLLTGAAFQGDRLFEELILARLLLDQGRLTECQGRLNELIILLETEPSILYEIMVYLLMALCSHRLDQAGEVRRLIGEALSLSAAEGYCRIWLDLAPGLKPLLEEWNREETGQLTGYASGLLAIWEQNEGGENLCSAGMADGSQNLTDREQEVLRRLNEGMSNKEIAQKLHITVATTKFHCSNIYRKLNVDHRQAAIQRARNKGLI